MSKTVENPEFGFRTLDPVPTRAELSHFYQSSYFDLLKKGGRAPELRRLMAGGPEGERERNWLAATLYEDIHSILRPTLPSPRVLDLGCGIGEFLAFLAARGLECVGLEPSVEAVELAQERGLDVRASTIEEYSAAHHESGAAGFGAITLLNVLEHVPNPIEVLTLCRELLVPGGHLVIRVPNDFNPLQLAIAEQTGREPWWIADPDHIHYFNFASLARTLEKTGFEPFRAQSDYPMEFFMMMGRDYTRDPAVGRECHAQRIALESALPAELRRELYADFARRGIGRNALVAGRRPS